MTIKNFLHQLKKKIQLITVSDPVNRQLLYLKYDFPGEISVEGQLVDFKKLDIKIKKDIAVPIIFNYQLAKNLVELCDASYILEGSCIYCQFNGIKVEIQTAEEIFILNEIWIEGTYNFSIPSKEQLVILDVGMNVGFASLYFARHLEDAFIYSFEPFKPTFLQAQKNISSNKEISKNITAFNYGLSSTDEVITVDYSPEHRGRAGIWGTDLVLEKMSNVRKEQLELRAFNDVFEEIIAKHPDAAFLLKIDCEGSEYAIFEEIDTKHFKNVKGVLLEWHRKGPMPISQKLESLGFSSVSFNPATYKVGMLYAFKT